MGDGVVVGGGEIVVRKSSSSEFEERVCQVFANLRDPNGHFDVDRASCGKRLGLGGSLHVYSALTSHYPLYTIDERTRLYSLR